MKRILILICALSLIGCAQAKLEISTDLYSEDPQYLTEEKIVSSLLAVTDARNAAIEMASSRKKIAEKMIGAYEAYLQLFAELMGETYNPKAQGSIVTLRSKPFLQNYQDEVEKKKKAIENLADEAVGYLSEHRQLVQLGSQVTSEVIEQRASSLKAARASIQNLRLLVSEFGNNWGTPFEQVFANTAFDKVKTDLTNMKLKMGELDGLTLDQQNTLVEKAKLLDDRFVSLADELQNLGLSARSTAKNLRKDSQAYDAGPSSQILAATGRAVKAFAETSLSFGINQQAKKAIVTLGQSMDFYTSQIDRLQDPADPVWREITNPKNKEKWNPYFSKTYFRAEGNTSVIVVRERAGHYRVKQGQNNPAALIQGQLKISRAITSGLIDVVGAGTGAGNLSGLLPETGDAGPTGKPAKAETIAEASAKIQAINKLRGITRTNLLSNLEKMKMDWATRITTNIAVPDNDLRNGRSLLESQKLIFDNLSKE